MTCRIPLSGSSVPLSNTGFPPFSTRITQTFAIGDTEKVFEFDAERDTLFLDLIASLRTALDAGTFMNISCTYCNTDYLVDADELAFDLASYHHAVFRVGVAENKRLKIVVTLSAAQVAALTVDIDLTGVQGNGCCRGPMPGNIANPVGACGRMSDNAQDLVGEEYPPFTTTVDITTDGAGNGAVDFIAQRDTLLTDLIVNGTLVAAGGQFANLSAKYCNTTYLDGSGIEIWDATALNHGVFVCGVAENKRLALTLVGGLAASHYRITLTGVQGTGCCR